MTIDELLVEYRRWAESYYCQEHINVLKMVFGVLPKYYGSTPAADFGPSKLRTLRDQMILGDANADRPRKPWSRKCVSASVQRMRWTFTRRS